MPAVEAYSEATSGCNSTYSDYRSLLYLTRQLTISGKKVNIQCCCKPELQFPEKTEGEAFTGTMFSVRGENSWLQFFADGTARCDTYSFR